MAFEEGTTLQLVASIFETRSNGSDGKRPQNEKEIEFAQPCGYAAKQSDSIGDNASMVETGNHNEMEGSKSDSKGRKFQCKNCPKWFSCAKNLWTHKKSCRKRSKRKPSGFQPVDDTELTGALHGRTKFYCELAESEKDDLESDGTFKPNNFSKLFGSKNGKVENKESVKQYSLRERDMNKRAAIVCDNTKLIQDLNAKAQIAKKIDLKCSIKKAASRKRKFGSQKIKKVGKRVKKQCTVCNKLMDPNALKYHMLAHRGERPFACQFCEYRCRTSPYLVTHVRRRHCSVKPFECEQCGEAFALKSLLNRHSRTHTDNFCCAVCGKGCESSNALKIHEISHKRKPYACDKCYKSFKTVSSLKIHSHLIHDREPNKKVDSEFCFECSECDCRYRTKYALTNHMKSHCDEPQFHCKRCSGVFRTRYRLRKHQLLEHSGENVEVCFVCGSTFTSEQKLKMHMQIH